MGWGEPHTPVGRQRLTDAVRPIIDGWRVIEDALRELGVAAADTASKMIVARLAQNDPPILLCFADEVKVEDERR